MLYTIKKGDTLAKIALKNRTTVKILARDNNIKNVNKIYAGQVLSISSNAASLPENYSFRGQNPLALVTGETAIASGSGVALPQGSVRGGGNDISDGNAATTMTDSAPQTTNYMPLILMGGVALLIIILAESSPRASGVTRARRR